MFNLQKIIDNFFQHSHTRRLKAFHKHVTAINALETEIESLTDEQLKAHTHTLRQKLQNNETLDAVLCEAFAVVREASKRTLGERHFDVQLISGMILHQGKIAEMKTGEGKTLAATLAVYLNALQGKGVHVVTVNDYLARRDSEWMGKIYQFLGLSVGCIVPGLDDVQRREAYSADVTYGTNNEFGFDYLRDNMKFHIKDMVQRPFNFAIVDEVDSILVDEARTPLIISGPSTDSSTLYMQIDQLIPNLSEDTYEKDEKTHTVTLNEKGVEQTEYWLKDKELLVSGSLYDMENMTLLHHVNQALRAHKLFSRDKDYIVKDNQVVIIDEFTGRMMHGRRYSEGLHQALEAKEYVTIQRENQTLASITFQNYFRLYPKLSGMTGTAVTEAQEFAEIYGLEVVEIPTNVPVIRQDYDDEVYRTTAEKYQAIVDLVEECRRRQQPVLIGTVSIEKSEQLSARLKKRHIPHNVLNARYHEQEAYIIAQAGKPGMVTIATNMAGRGTDIQLGGNLSMYLQKELGSVKHEQEYKVKEERIRQEIEEDKQSVKEAGGLYVVGTERHESRRIDNQLRGRSGRQGDPGASKFFLSLEDDLMRIFGSDRIDSMLEKLGLQEGEAIVHKWINKALERAQKKVEAHHFEIRKNLLKFDNVMNDQRKVIYEQRREIMSTEDISDVIGDMRHTVIEEMVRSCIPEKVYVEQWDLTTLHKEVKRVLGLELPLVEWSEEEEMTEEVVEERIQNAADKRYSEKVLEWTPEVCRIAEKSIVLQLLDYHWKDHLLSLDHLRQGINLRAYGQRDPLNEYKRESFELFEQLLTKLRTSVTFSMMHLEVRSENSQSLGLSGQRLDHLEYRHDTFTHGEGKDVEKKKVQPVVKRTPEGSRDPSNPSTWGKISRNSLCPCGSQKKYKHCHGKVLA